MLSQLPFLATAWIQLNATIPQENENCWQWSKVSKTVAIRRMQRQAHSSHSLKVWLEWEYRKGAYNIADPLSRRLALLSMQASQAQASQSHKDLSKVIKESYAQDPWFHDPSHLKILVYEDGFYKKGTQVLVPCDSRRKLRKFCISVHHDPPYAGHLGGDRTLEQVRRHLARNATRCCWLCCEVRRVPKETSPTRFFCASLKRELYL